MGRRRRYYQDLERELAELERTNPAVKKAADEYDRVRAAILQRASWWQLTKFGPRMAKVQPLVPLPRPGSEPEIAPGVHGYLLEEPDGIWIPIINAAREGSGDVARFLDSLPRDRAVHFPAVLNPRLAGMLARRGYELRSVWVEEYGEHTDVWVRAAAPELPAMQDLGGES